MSNVGNSGRKAVDAVVPYAAVKSKRGFANMDPKRVREIASMGGVAAHNKGTAHEFTFVEAKIAGRKGGLAKKKKHG